MLVEIVEVENPVVHSRYAEERLAKVLEVGVRSFAETGGDPVKHARWLAWKAMHTLREIGRNG